MDMNRKDFLWEIFEETGDINMYLDFRGAETPDKTEGERAEQKVPPKPALK